MLMKRSLGHPARWLDVAAAVAVAEDDWFVRVEWRSEVVLRVDLEPHMLLWCYVTPSIWSPHGGKEPIVRQDKFALGRENPLSDRMYVLLWACMSTVSIVWPIGRIGKGPTQ